MFVSGRLKILNRIDTSVGRLFSSLLPFLRNAMMSNVKSTASEMYVQCTKRFSLRILSITLQHKLTLDSD